MKKIYSLFALFIYVSVAGQTYVYNFKNTFAEQGGIGPTLTEVLTCSASAGNFSSQPILSCGTQTAFNFNSGDGFSFDNSSMLIESTYTINMLFKFNSLSGTSPSGSQRVIDFTGGLNDAGIYLFSSGCLEFSNGGTLIGSCPNFSANTFILFTLVRDGASGETDIYINGALFETIIDGGLYAPDTFTTPITFFIDETGPFQCEDGPGSIRYLSLTPATSTAAQVLNTWNTLCTTVLPLQLLDFHANKQNTSVVLSWTTSSEINTSHFELERSSTGSNFSKLADIPMNNNNSITNNYSYIDRQPLSKGFYRLKLVDIDGNFKYSGILNISFAGTQKFEVYPNPINDVLTVTGVNANEMVRLLNSDGKILLQKRASGQSMTMDVSKYPSGIYILQYFDGTNMQNLKVAKE